MDDELPRRKEYSPSPARMSKTPSWIMLGFILGALFVAALPPLRKKPAGVDRPPPPAFTRPPARPPQPLSTIEAVFEGWHKFAVWSDDTTEVALWNTEYREFADVYEVRRVGPSFYFRTLPALTRRPYTPPNLPPDCPLRFTETDEHYRARLEQGAGEDFRRPAQTVPRAPAPTVEPSPPFHPPELPRPVK